MQEMPGLEEGRVRSALVQALEVIRRELGERLSRVFLYGSRARGDHRPGSDLDLMVLVRGGGRGETQNALQQALAEVPWEVHAWVMGEREFQETRPVVGGLAYAVGKEGVEICRTPGGALRPSGLRSPEEVRREFVRGQIERARGDLRAARVLFASRGLEGDYTNPVLRARSGVEWAIRASLIAAGVEIPSHHRLEGFARALEGVDRGLAERLRPAILALSPFPFDSLEWDWTREPISQEEASGRLEQAEGIFREVADWLVSCNYRMGSGAL